jgi:hypothetical protein
VYNTVVRLCQFFGCGGKYFSKWEHISTTKSYWVTLLWSTSQCVYFIRPKTLLLCIFLFCIFLLYRADSQVEVQITILHTCCMWAGGTYFQLCCCVNFWFWWEIGFGFTYLCTYSTIQFWCCVSFWFWREIVFGVRYVLSVQYSCAVVSVFWLWWGIVLKMTTCFYKKILLGYFIMIR